MRKRGQTTYRETTVRRRIPRRTRCRIDNVRGLLFDMASQGPARSADDASRAALEWLEAERDNWAIATVFQQLGSLRSKVDQWATSDREFVKRAGFALLWSLALHDRATPDDRFVHGLGLIEREAGDGRHLVDKAVGMALRAIGKRRSSLTVAAISVAERLAASEVPAAQRIGRPALNELRRSTSA